jgi:hypothetical protein
LMSFPPGTEMFQFPGFASTTYVFSRRFPCGRVAPFGHPRIKACSRLPMAYRSVPRPSSPPGAKASTECPYCARDQHWNLIQCLEPTCTGTIHTISSQTKSGSRLNTIRTIHSAHMKHQTHPDPARQRQTDPRIARCSNHRL